MCVFREIFVCVFRTCYLFARATTFSRNAKRFLSHGRRPVRGTGAVEVWARSEQCVTRGNTRRALGYFAVFVGRSIRHRRSSIGYLGTEVCSQMGYSLGLCIAYIGLTYPLLGGPVRDSDQQRWLLRWTVVNRTYGTLKNLYV